MNFRPSPDRPAPWLGRLLTLLLALSGTLRAADALPAAGNFSRTNLVAWCIVPFDTKKRSPEERAAMLDRLGITRLAYDWRTEHIPSFDTEVETMQKHGIAITAWWFPAALNDEAKAILACLERHRIHPELWVTMGTEPEPDAAKLETKLNGAVETLVPICAAAAKVGSRVGLYNHLGWFGEPTNQVRILERLRARGHANAGIVYNFHHGHAHLDRFAEYLTLMRPYLLGVNLNGMIRDGDRVGKKITPLGTGTEELGLLRTLQRSGWQGPIGILGHTEEDAEVKLRSELRGLEQLVPRLAEPATPSTPEAKPRAAAAPAATPDSGRTVNRDEPWKQIEGDWVDDRWNQTVLAPWQAYYFPTPTGNVRKGLAIRLRGEASGGVIYDTANGNWRAGWAGDFLRFDPARFGLLNAPRPRGEVRFSLPANAGWTGGAFRWKRFVPVGDRVTLEYTVGDTEVREAAGLTTASSAPVFLREWEIASGSTPLTVVVAELPKARATPAPLPHATSARLATDSTSVEVAVLAEAGAEGASLDITTPDQIRLTFPPRAQLQRVRLLLRTGAPANDGALAMLTQHEHSHPTPVLAVRGAVPAAAAPTVVQVAGQRGPQGATDAYVIDTIPVPYENPTRSLMFCSGIGFFDNGDAAVATIHGEVWRVSGLDESLRAITWTRIATGLYQPLGLEVVSNQVVVLCRDHLTRLVDRDGDRITDAYEALSSLIDTSDGGHDYVTSLCRDDAGNFYYVDPVGAHRISPDGQQRETIARGFRNPNGMGVSPDGKILTVAPQQGTWTPSSVIHELRADGWYGYGGPKVTPERPLGYDLPLCWIPHRVDNSSGSQVWARGEKFGPLSGQLLHLSWGRCTMLLTLRDVEDGVAQGAVVPLKGRFLSGPMRGATNPRDGQLYVVGCQGWQTAAARDGSFQRVRWTGKPLVVPSAWRALPGRLRVTFNSPLGRELAQDTDSYGLEAWNYRYSENYGSEDWRVTHPNQTGHDTWKIEQARLLEDGKTVELAVPEIQPVMQFALKFNLETAEAKPVAGEMYGTVHRLGKP